MTNSFQKMLLTLGLGCAAALAAPVAISPAFAQGADMPTCSATVTDHCMQRGGGGHRMAMNGHHAGRMAHRHHRMARHHHRMGHHHRMAEHKKP